MNRRAYLAALGAAGALAGCLDAVGDSQPTATAGGSNRTRTRGTVAVSEENYDTSLAAQGLPATICSEAIQEDPGIYAIDEPAFGSDWRGIDVPQQYQYAVTDGDLDPEHNVVGLETGDGRARAYPIQILARHEIVNDDFGGPVIVTFCPICRSGMVADARVRDEPTTFAVSGLLWQPERLRVADAQIDNRTFGAERSGGEVVDVRANGNLVMYDLATGSYWSQILATAICGPETGASLTIRPSTLSTWGDWQREHPDTDVLLPTPHSGAYVPDDEFVGQTPAPPES